MLSNNASEGPNAYRIVEVTTKFIGPASHITGKGYHVKHEVQCQTERGWAKVDTCGTLVEARRWLVAHLPNYNC